MMESLFNDAQSLQMAPGDETLVLSLDELKSMVADETGSLHYVTFHVAYSIMVCLSLKVLTPEWDR